MRELKVMKTRDQRFTDIAPKVYHTICIPSKVCVIHFATRVAIVAGKSWDVGNECSWRRILQIVRRSDCRFRLFFYRHGLMKVCNCLFSGLFSAHLFLQLLVYLLLSPLISFLSQEVFVIVMEELTGHVTHFNTIDNAPEVWDQDDIKVNL